MGEELRQLVRKRGNLKARLTLFEKHVNAISNEIASGEKTGDEAILCELENRVEKQENLFTEFNEIQSQIEDVSEEFEEQISERDTFESTHFKSVGLAKKLIKQIEVDERSSEIKQTEVDAKSSDSKSSSKKNVVESKNSVGRSIKLPQMKLPTFRGSYDTWLEFRDTFQSVVHKRSDLDDIEKFHYVRAHLEGEPKQVIGSLEFSAQNYSVAWDLLCDRYGNKRVLIQSHIKSLLDVPNLTQESCSGLRKMLDNVSQHIRALASLKVDTKEWDVLLIYLLSSKLDKKTEREWEEFKISGELPTLEEFKGFIKNKADILEKIEINHGGGTKLNNNNVNINKPKQIKAFTSVKLSCTLCRGEHFIANCSEFLKLKTYQRSEQIKQLRLCLNCLKQSHISKDCKSSVCKRCGRKHHTLLHFERQVAPSSEVTNTSNKSDVEVGQVSEVGVEKEGAVSVCNFVQSKHVLLSTALVQVVSVSGKIHECRVLLDSGSQSNFISESLCSKLGLEKTDVSISVSGISQVVSVIKFKCVVEIQSMRNAFKTNLSCLVLPKIGENIPRGCSSVSDLNIPNHLRLADPEFFKPGEIDILIGVELFYGLLCQGQVRLGEGKPILQKTVLGWIVSGPINSLPQTSVSCNLATSCEIQNQLAKFWELEEPCSSVIVPLSEEERQCEKVFVETTQRNADGRFIVNIPLRENPSNLGDSKETALKRFKSLENRFQKNSKFREMYVEFMEEYLRLGHMSEVSEKSDGKVRYYLPHHGVVNEKSLTTKMRVVFDASCPTSSGVSLNDIQHVGATIQGDLLSIIMRFRLHRIVMCADVEKMYRMVLINPDQRSLQSILWRSNPSDSLSVYELNTVTYGTASAPFLAVRCLKQLADECVKEYPRAAEAISEDFYVDDFISGAETVEEAIRLSTEVSCVLSSGCFNLRKWISNSVDVIKSIELSSRNSDFMQFGDKENTKMLGLYWSCQSDVLMYKIRELQRSKGVTKRSILSDISQVFDPLGLLSPCVVQAKILLQKLWLLKLSWDETLPKDMCFFWQNYRQELVELNNLQIPRRVVIDNHVKLEIHGFADASQLAYGACVYLRSVNKNDETGVYLLCSKTRVAPLKMVTVPRLELCAALVLAQLVSKVQISLRQSVDSVYLWSDSTVVLGWIRSSSSSLQTFVANRVSQIHSLSDINSWHHVDGKSNPADLLSRGLSPTNLISSSQWWHGPQWLCMNELSWPHSDGNYEGELPDVKIKPLSVLTVTQGYKFPFERFSSFLRMKRVVAYCLRFKDKCQGKPSEQGPLTARELEASQMCLVKLCQQECFPNELKALRRGDKLNVKSKVLSLNPFIDEKGVLRVGGRLGQSNFEYDKRHPMILSGNHHFTKLLFDHEHKRLFHAGPTLLLASVREKFWPMSGKNLAKFVVHKCVRCYRCKPSKIQPIMGMLPKDRVEPTPPFYITGVDYAGPFYIKTKQGRGAKLQKCYVSVFVCFSTKAIHLEVVSDLTKDSFICALRRFVSRRGRPARIYSDNGTNFVGANAELKDITTFLAKEGNSLIETCTNDNIEWHFIPAASPHFGGLWEAGVKSMKFHLKRVLANAQLTFEQFATVLTQIEAILNSRPLTPLSSDPGELEALTPSHFLIGRQLSALPDLDVKEIPVNRLSKFQHLQQLQQHFWSRWTREYVGELQNRVKWNRSVGELAKGALVVVRDDNLPPLKWNLGRIVELHPGKDKVARVASVKTKGGIIKRSFAKLCPLPCESMVP